MTRATMTWDVPEDRDGEPTCHDWSRAVGCPYLVARAQDWWCGLFDASVRSYYYLSNREDMPLRPCQQCQDAMKRR